MNISKQLIIALAVSLAAMQAGAQSPSRRDMETARGMEILLNIYRDVNLFYVDSIKSDKLLQDAAGGMLEQLDPYSQYIPAREMGDFEFITTGKYGGIGSLIRQRGDWVEIAEPYMGTPSDRATLKAGDRLLSIDGVSLESLGSQKVSDMLKGEPGTKFSLTVRPMKDTTTTRTVEIVREKIVVPGVPYFGMVADSVGYIRLSNFTEGCAVEVKTALEKLRSSGAMKRVILDLRGNGGGIVGEAIDIVGLFVPMGTDVLKIRGRVDQMNSTYTTRHAPLDLNSELVVIVNSSSASASEIVAGALQDLDRAVIVGQRSFGKGLVQATRPVAYDGILKLTTAKYYTPSGRCIQALDYTHRKEDGSVGHVPDSIIKVYTTTTGRKVYDGGGVMPDVRMEAQYLSQFGAILTAYGFIDDFANLYAAHNERSSGAFEVNDKVYDGFMKFMVDKPITYQSMSSRALNDLRTALKREKYDSRVSAEIEAIESKIKDDKMAQLVQFKDELKELLADAIITRWSYAAGAIENSIRDDNEIQKAIEILDNKAEYNRILTSQDTEKNFEF